MADEKADRQEALEYEFEDLRRNEDPVPPHIAAQFGFADDAGEEEVDDDPDGEPDARDEEVDRRIAKIRKDADRRIEAAKDEAGQVISKLEQRIDKLESAGEEETLQEAYEAKMAELQEQIDEAVESGDTKKASQLTTEVSRLTAEHVTKREGLKRKKDEHAEPDDLDQRQQPQMIPRAREWLIEQDWWDDPEHRKVRRYVNRVDEVLRERGYSPEDDDYYERLEDLVEKKYPGIITQTMDGSDELEPDDDEFVDVPDKRSRSRRRQRRAGGRAPVNGQGDEPGSGGERRRGGGKRGKTLTRSQVTNMRVFGMDPSDPKQVEAYLAEVRD